MCIRVRTRSTALPAMSWQPWRCDDGWRGGRGQSRDRPYGGKGHGGGGYAGGGNQTAGYTPHEGGGYGPEERPCQDPARGKGMWNAGRAEGAAKGANRMSVSEALDRICAISARSARSRRCSARVRPQRRIG